MHVTKSRVAALCAAASVTVAIAAAPLAVADTCDPAVTICQGGGVQTGSSSTDYAPQVSADDDQYPTDGDWYFNPAGGSTPLQQDHGPASSGGGGSTGGGHH
jgi:hypothetical protein